MERTPPSECAATVRGDNDRRSTHDGIGMDGAWYCQRVCEEKFRCGQIRTCQSLSKSLHSSLLIIISLV